MIKTRITQEYGLSAPICCAGMAMIAQPELAAAVSNAGGLGTFSSVPFPPEVLRGAARRMHELTNKPFGVDFVTDLIQDEHIQVCVEERIPVVVFFWNPPKPEWVQQLRAAGSKVWMQVGSVAEAQQAAALNLDAIVCQGSEGGGHNKSVGTTFTLLPAVRAAVAPIPVIAAGGITDGRGMAAALALGAEAVWCGTRFLASVEANAHADYKQRVLTAQDGQTQVSTLFGPEWPDQPMRVLRNRVVSEWTGREEEAKEASQDGETIGTFRMGPIEIPMPKFTVLLATAETTCDVEDMGLTMGESAVNITDLKPAAEIVRDMMREARDTIRELSHHCDR